MKGILLGELEFNEPHYHCDGSGPSYLWVGRYEDGALWYEESSSNLRIGWGNITVFKEERDVMWYLKVFICGTDVDYGRLNEGEHLIQSFKGAKVRLKGMTEWISNDKISEDEAHK